MADINEKEEGKGNKALTVKMARQPGPEVRIIGDTEWSEAAGWVQDVSLDLAADLLAYPHPGWSLGERPSAAVRKALADRLGVAPENIAVPGEPLRFAPSLTTVVGRERAVEMATMGITVRQIAALKTTEEINDLAFRTGATPAEIAGWIERAAA